MSDAAVVEALARYVDAPQPPSADYQRCIRLFLHLLSNDPTFRLDSSRPRNAASFSHALKRAYRPLLERGVLISVNGSKLVKLERIHPPQSPT